MDMSGSLWIDACGVGLKLLIIFSSDKLTKGSIMLKQADVASGADFLQVMAESGVRKREGFLRGSGYWRHQSRASSRFPGDQTSVGDGRVQDSQRSVLLPQSRLRCCCAVVGLGFLLVSLVVLVMMVMMVMIIPSWWWWLIWSDWLNDWLNDWLSDWLFDDDDHTRSNHFLIGTDQQGTSNSSK